MAEKPFRFDGPIYVLCEGPADVRLVTRLIERENLEGFSVNFAKGYQEFARHVKALRVSPDWRKLSRLLIIGDNDVMPAQRWQNASDALALEGGRPPRIRETSSTVHRPTGIFMVPEANADGALETLLVRAIVRAHPDLGACLQQLDECQATDCETWDAVKRAQNAVSDRRGDQVSRRSKRRCRPYLVEDAQSDSGRQSCVR